MDVVWQQVEHWDDSDLGVSLLSADASDLCLKPQFPALSPFFFLMQTLVSEEGVHVLTFSSVFLSLSVVQGLADAV